MKHLSLARSRAVGRAASIVCSITLLLSTTGAAAASNGASVCGSAAGQATAMLALLDRPLGALSSQAAQAGLTPDLVHDALCQP